jgi:hypothetical protein
MQSTHLKHLRITYPHRRLLTVYPAAHLAAGTALEPAELDELFVEGGSASRP